MTTLALGGCMANMPNLPSALCFKLPGDQSSPTCPDEDLPTGTIVGSEAPDALATSVPASELKPQNVVTRSDVADDVGFAAPRLPKEIAPRGVPSRIEGRRAASAGNISLRDAVAKAVLSHPQVGAQAARVQGVNADVRSAESQLLPSMELLGGTGVSPIGSYDNYPNRFSNINVPNTSRTDVGFLFKQLVYDFGAARSDIARNRAASDAERLKLADVAEDISLRTVNAYFNLLEQSELIVQINDTVTEERRLAGLVKQTEQAGAGTQADVDRINARIIEIEATKTDIETAYRVAVDEFYRLTGLEPKQVRKPQGSPPAIPARVEQAILDGKSSNPALLATRATSSSLGHQLDAAKAQTRPRLDIIGDGQVKNYVGNHAASNGSVDIRAMLVLSYKLMDGGLSDAQMSRIRANQDTNFYKQLDDEEALELNLRRLYQTLIASTAKQTAAEQGVKTAETVQRLYTEQFKEGRRQISDVLDSTSLLFNMRKNKINGQYDSLRATYGILRQLGRLTETIARS